MTFDVTALVKAAVAGDLGSSRYTRIALIDMDSSTSESFHTYATPEDSNTAARPALKVTYGGSAPKPTRRRIRSRSRHRAGRRCASFIGIHITVVSAPTASGIQSGWSHGSRNSSPM